MGIKVRTNRHGYLFLRIFWKGRDVWIGVKERDDGPRGEKRTLVEAKARLIAEELRNGTPLRLAVAVWDRDRGDGIHGRLLDPAL
jgi:hypothetical protein